jgi:hypothetical protein
VRVTAPFPRRGTADLPRRAARTTAALPSLLLALAGPLAAQDDGTVPPADLPEEVVARFVLDGETAYVTGVQVAEEFVRREFATARGKEALEHVVMVRLVMREAGRLGLVPDDVTVRERLEEMRSMLEQAGTSLDTFLTERGYDLEGFRERILVPTIAHERLVMRAMKFENRARVTPDLLQLWVDEARERLDVVTDPEVLGFDIAARIGDEEIPRIDVGEVLRATAPPDGYEQVVKTIVLRRLIDAAAREAGIEITMADARAEVEARRAKASRNPEFDGLTFEELLATQGLTPESFARSGTLLAQLQERRLVERRWTDEALDEFIAERRDDVLATYGPRRKLSILFLRASETPNELVPRTFELARTEAERLREGIHGLADFAAAARRHSDEPGTKARGGEVGWLHRASDLLPDALLAAAFDLPAGSTTEPVQTPNGVWLAHVDAIEPAVEPDELRRRVLQDRTRAWRYELLESARLEILRR